MRHVMLAALGAVLIGCGGNGGTDRASDVPDPAELDGAWDATTTGEDGTPFAGVAEVGGGEHRRVGITLPSTLGALTLTGTLLPNGTLPLTGSGLFSDIGIGAEGTARVWRDGERLRIAGTLTTTFDELAVELERPAADDAPATLTVPIRLRGTSVDPNLGVEWSLTLTVDARGSCRSAATTLGDAALGAGTCLLAPGGGFALRAPYTSARLGSGPLGGDWLLRLVGTRRSDRDPEWEGVYGVQRQPTGSDLVGSWQGP